MPPIMLLAVASLGFGFMAPQEARVEAFIDFRSETGSDWYPVNDGVMGGRSLSSMHVTNDGRAVFEGDLSLENNGGFASVRTEVPVGTLAGSSRLFIRVRGDGKRYQMRLRMSTAFDGVAYSADFDTTVNAWTVVEIPLRSFEPSFRGYRPRDAELLDPAKVRQVGIMLTDKQAGPFRLEVEWIGARRSHSHDAGEDTDNSVQEERPVVAVSELDLSKYSGRWYEISRFPNRFQDDCSGEVTATYRLREDGRIDVINECRDADGKPKLAEGIAKLDAKGGPASKLKVRFAPGILSWLPFVWADYWVLALDDKYTHAAVGTPNRDYLWILSRTPQMNEDDYSSLVEQVADLGFAIERLERTRQAMVREDR